ncbi:MAG: VOC family protein [Acidimicrobiales bacterium]
MDDTVASGHPSWADLATSDVVAAECFYREVFGWAVTSAETSMGDFYVGSVGDRDVAGMIAQPQEMAGAPSVWTSFFYVDDLDDTIDLISAAGGTVLQKPAELPDGTRVGVVADPCGAMFALISGRPQPGPYLSPIVGAIGWFELMTNDPQTAEAFYGTVFGWTASTDDVGGTPYTVFSLDDTHVAGMIKTPANLPASDAPDTWSVYFNVGDCDATAKLTTENGGQAILPPTDTPMGRFAVLADPQGAVFQIMESAEVA